MNNIDKLFLVFIFHMGIKKWIELFKLQFLWSNMSSKREK